MCISALERFDRESVGSNLSLKLSNLAITSRQYCSSGRCVIVVIAKVSDSALE